MGKPREYCIEFWDFGQWNEVSNTRRKHKAECVEIAQEWNRKMSHENRKSFEGHRYRVRARNDQKG